MQYLSNLLGFIQPEDEVTIISSTKAYEKKHEAVIKLKEVEFYLRTRTNFITLDDSPDVIKTVMADEDGYRIDIGVGSAVRTYSRWLTEEERKEYDEVRNH